MQNNYIFTSARLGFRTWKLQDRFPFAEMNNNLAVMEFFPSTLDQA